MAIFSPHHSFTNIHVFLKTFDGLSNRQAVTQVALGIPQYCNSVVVKLQNSRIHLDNILSVNEWNSSSSILSSSSGSTPSTLSTTYFPMPAFSPQTVKVSGDVDDFFGNLFSAFDIFAQIVNLVYLSPPMRQNQVSLDKLVQELLSISTLRADTITTFFVALKRSRWFRDMKPFRKCATHDKSIPFKVVTEFEPLQFFTSNKVKAILLPDDPFSNSPTYNMRLSMRIFGASALRNALNAIDSAFRIMESRISAAGRVPI